MRLTELVHAALRQQIQKGDRVIDATAGNGHDTLFLAQCVGASGFVHAFDTQEIALANTRNRISEAGCDAEVMLCLACHSSMHDLLASLFPQPTAIVFNLGWLPGANHAHITRPITTIAALHAAWKLLAPGGIISVVSYRGHEGGQDECNAVSQWVDQASIEGAHVTVTTSPSPTPLSPIWFLIRKA